VDGRKETDGREVCCKERRAVEAASILPIDADMDSGVPLQKKRLEASGGTGVTTKFPTVSGLAEPHGKTEREIALLRNDRADSVFDTLIEVLEEAPEALSLDYSEDFLCDLVRAHAPDVTTEEIVAALDVLSARAIALRELMLNECRPGSESR
jgi:hypothetical protein